MTTFEVPRTVYRLEFQGQQWDGLVVRVRAMSFAEWQAHHELLFTAWWADPDVDAKTRDQKTHEVHVLFADHLIDWNLAEDGKPVPATLEGLQSQESPFIGNLITAWRANTSGVVPAPLVPPSADGDPSAEQLIPMEPLSKSLAS